MPGGMGTLIPMFHTPHPDLNEEERAVLGIAPEACLRRAVQRGVLSLDCITEHLSPHTAAVVRSIVAGERAPEPSVEEAFSPPKSEPANLPEVATAPDARWQADYQSLGAWPGLQRAVDEDLLTPGEALGVANTTDRSLGRYMTGPLYAAP